jgi:hypothetical protein
LAKLDFFASPVKYPQMPPAAHWKEIDERLLRLKLVELAEEMQSQVKADEKRIRSENYGNLNTNAVSSLLLQMQQDRADEWARRTYEIYCDVWQKQGHTKSSSFLRVVFARGIQSVLHARAMVIAHEFGRSARRTNLPVALQQAHLRSLQQNMARMENRWRRRLEIEAKECEHAERLAELQRQVERNAELVTSERRSITVPAVCPPTLVKEDGGPILAEPNTLIARRPGRRSTRSEAFVVCAGTLWQRAIRESGSHASVDRLREIALALDAAGYLPPANYLEGKYAKEVKDFNSCNSHSKIGPLRTWSQLVAHGDKDHIQGMRRTLARCAEKVAKTYPSDIRN